MNTRTRKPLTQEQHLAPFRSSFPAVSTSDHWGDRVVLQGHADACALWGHATHTIDGVEQPRCPRCGEIKPTDSTNTK